MAPKVENAIIMFRVAEGEPNPLELDWQGKHYVLYSDTERKLPLDLIDHLNNDCRYPRHELVKDEKTGQQTSKIVGYIHRFYCIPIDLRKTAEKQAEAGE